MLAEDYPTGQWIGCVMGDFTRDAGQQAGAAHGAE